MKIHNTNLNRRSFLANGALFVGSAFLGVQYLLASDNLSLNLKQAKEGLIPAHFPSSLHAFVWRNWSLVPLDRMAKTIQATETQIYELGKWMGLPDVDLVDSSQWDRSYLTVIRRNWHLLPRDQLLTLMDWADELPYQPRYHSFSH